MRSLITVFAIFLLAGCSKKPPAAPSQSTSSAASSTPSTPALPPPIPGLPSTFKVKQRTQTAIPGSDLVLVIDDITRGAVLTSLRAEKEVAFQPVYLKQNERKAFEYRQRKYELVLSTLDNALIGEDFATFELRESHPADAVASEPLTEQQKIDRLIAKVESLKDAKFLRNGAEHTSAEAGKHLREKRDYAGDRLKTAEEFIEQVGARSSLSGEEYEIRFSDGRTIKSGEFLRQELKALAPPAAAATSPPAS